MEFMKPAVVFPLGEISEVLFRHLQEIAPALANLFESAYVSVSPSASTNQPEFVEWLEQQDLFHVIHLGDDLPVGVHFRSLYQAASEAAPAQQVLHLCFIDRLAYALQGEHREFFKADILSLDPEITPLIYQRSEKAWATHPEQYRIIEDMVTRTGELLFGQSLDYAWCHIALLAGDLKTTLKQVNQTDLSMVAEMVLALRPKFMTKDVDWLAWEDPFILARDAEELKAERENSAAETQKRFSYAIPMLQLLQAASRNGDR